MPTARLVRKGRKAIRDRKVYKACKATPVRWVRQVQPVLMVLRVR